MKNIEKNLAILGSIKFILWNQIYLTSKIILFHDEVSLSYKWIFVLENIEALITLSENLFLKI